MLVMAISLVWIVLGFFGEPPRDPNRLRYLYARVQVEALAKAVERYRADCGRYPSADEGLGGLILDEGVEGWHGPYLKEVPLDPWRRPFIYVRPADSATPEILSYGADGRPGGEFYNSDISSGDLQRSISLSPFEVREGRILTGSWIGAWLCLIGAWLCLSRTSRHRKG